MNINVKETLIGLQLLGLNLDTGKSPTIFVKDLERLTNIRQVSNGSKIVRKDCKTFSKFNYSINYGQNGEVVSYLFNGYKNVNQVIEDKNIEIIRLKEKIDNLLGKVECVLIEIENLLQGEDFTYSKEDLET